MRAPDETSVAGIDDRRFEAAMRAFHIGPPGILRSVSRVDSAPPHEPVRTSGRDERTAIAEAIKAYVEYRPNIELHGLSVEEHATYPAASDKVCCGWIDGKRVTPAMTQAEAEAWCDRMSLELDADRP